MQRDKKGRFVKKASLGTTIEDPNQQSSTGNVLQQFQFQNPFSNYDVNGNLLKMVSPGIEAAKRKNNIRLDNLLNLNTQLGKTPKIKYIITDDGRVVDEYGNNIGSDIFRNETKDFYQHDGVGQYLHNNNLLVGSQAFNYNSSGLNGQNDLSLYEKDGDLSSYTDDDLSAYKQFAQGILEQDKSSGMNLKDKLKNFDYSKIFNSDTASTLSELFRTGLGISLNNKIAQRSLDAEIPLLQDTLEQQRNVYGNYRALTQGEKNAAQIRNLASKPQTSDGALQQQMMLDAQSKAQEYINQGLQQDDALIKQTKENALVQNQQNQQQRLATAMANRQAMLKTNQNKTNILNMRDSANFSQNIIPILANREQQLKTKNAENKRNEILFKESLLKDEVWNNYSEGLSEEQKTLKDKYLHEGYEAVQKYIKENDLSSEWLQLQQIMNGEIAKQKGLLYGVDIESPYRDLTDPYKMWTGSQFQKQGGTIYKARLVARTKDKDRNAKAIESSKKIAARFLEKAMDSLYTYDSVELIAKPSKSRKYQAGGAIPFVSTAPINAATPTKTSASPTPTTEVKKNSQKDDGLTSKDLFQLVEKLDGLPADMQVIFNSLASFQVQGAGDPLGLATSSNIESKYLNILSQLKMANFNKKEYDQAYEKLSSNGGLEELAITSEGMLIGTNKEGDFQYYSPEEVVKGKNQKEGYQLLTNSNLLYLRANSPDAAFNHKLTTVAQNGIGIKQVMELMQATINNLGTNESSQEGFVSTQKGQVITGLQAFQEAVQKSGTKFVGTVNDLYKYKHLTKSQAEQAQKAMQFVYQALPNSAKALLKVKSDGSDNGALKLIEQLFAAKINNVSHLELDLQAGDTKSKTSGNGSGKDDDKLKTSLPLNVQKDIGGSTTQISIDRGDGIHISVRGTQYNLVTTPNGEAIMDTSLAGMLSKSGLQGIIKDLKNIQFGDQKISPEVLSKITYNNTGITRAILPINADGSVNFSLLDAFEKAEREIELSDNNSVENKKAIFTKHGLNELLNEDGSYNQKKLAPFILAEGYTTDSLSGLKESSFVKEYKGDEDAAVDIIKRSLTIGEGKNAKEPEIDTKSWYNPADWFGMTDTIFKGVVYIPITNNVNAAVQGANQNLDYDEAMVQEEKYQNFDKVANQKSTNSSVLNI